MSRQKSLGETERGQMYGAANMMCSHGIQVADDPQYRSDYPGDHTLCLLFLTAARLRLSEGNRRWALRNLNNAENWARSIADTRQRVRVYAKLGLLYRKCFRLITGFEWGIRACFVRGVPKNVRIKAIAALLHFDR